MTTVKILPILLAAAASVVIGGVWYSPFLFGTMWSRLSGVDTKSDTRKRAMPKLLVIMFFSAVVTAYVLSYVATQFNVALKISYFRAAITAAGMLWLGFTAIRMYVNNSFDDRPTSLT